MTESKVSRVPFSDLARLGNLFLAYCSDHDRVASFYPRDWRSDESMARAVADAASYPRDRELLVEVLLEQNERWGAKEASTRNAERLADPTTVAVVTGQQVGLFGGPMYTVLKIVTAIQLAQRIGERTGHSCVPVFWLEGEDHDFEEVSSIHIPHEGALRTLSLTSELSAGMQNTGPVGRIPVGDQIVGLIDELEETLPATEFLPQLIEFLRDAYRPDSSFRDAFARLMGGFFPDQGLVFISPDNAHLKALLAPLFDREISDYRTSFDRLQTRTDEIAPLFHPEVHPRPMSLFMLEPEGRIRVDPSDAGNGFTLRGLARTYTEQQMHDIVAEDSCRLSPNVVLRPLSQDHLLPTAAYVAGPSEIAYFAQLGPIYDWAGIPMPVIYPRASTTIVEPRIRKSLDKLDISVTDVSGDLAALIKNKALSEMELDLDGLFLAKTVELEREFDELRDVAGSLDASLVNSVESAMAGIRKQLDGIKNKFARAAKRNHEHVSRSIEKAASGLYPNGKLQERIVSPLYFVAKYGLDMPVKLVQTLSLDTDQHQVLDV